MNGQKIYSGLLGEVQSSFRKGRRTEDNLFMLERLIEMVNNNNFCLKSNMQ